jgi:peptidoglycan/xylan/chitin deacetylase (PgdA/CDA1 family)
MQAPRVREAPRVGPAAFLVLLAVVLALVAPAAGRLQAASAFREDRPAARPVLTFGSRGRLVRKAQALLNRRGYRVPVTGFYGVLTVRQVRRFQVDHGIRNTGQVGPLTWPVLLRGDGTRAGSASGRPILTVGSRGGAVRTAQSLLRRRGYRVPVTGFYGALTVRQVRRFQADHGIRNTGQVGPLTWPALLGGGGHVAAAAARSGGVVYLTFDDGPTPAYTPRVLGLLARYRARATFFVVGRSAVAWPGLVRREFAAGHGVGNHTFTHAPLPGLGGRRLEREVGGTSRAIRRATGAPPRCLRPPYGAIDAASARRVGAFGLRVVTWSLDSNDWRGLPAGAIAGRVLGRVRSGDVVLMHDGGGNRAQTVAALGTVLASLSARGFRFAALCRG